MNSIINSIIAFFMSIYTAILSLFGFSTGPDQNLPEEQNITNVIYMIGDGMGCNHIEKTRQEREASLALDSFSVKGSAITRSLSSSVTDSAAAGTALATGVRTGNGIIGAYYDDKDIEQSYPKNLLELCAESGMLTGIITTDSTSGATPAAFSAHSSSRNNTEDISLDQLSSDIDLIWGKKVDVITRIMAEDSGYTYVSTYDEMMALPEGGRSFAQFTRSLWVLEPKTETPNLEQMAVKAVDILDDTQEGFVLVIEGAHIDKHSHNEEGDKMTEALLEFDKTVAAMLEYAENDGETLVIVTADHETGGITLQDGKYVYSNGSHSGVDVPLYVYGCADIITDGETINNYEIPIRISEVLGFGEEDFPISVNVK